MSSLPASAAAQIPLVSSIRFLADETVRMIGVEAGGSGNELGQHAARFNPNGGGRPGVLQGTMSYILQDEHGRSRRRIPFPPGWIIHPSVPNMPTFTIRGAWNTSRRLTPKRSKLSRCFRNSKALFRHSNRPMPSPTRMRVARELTSRRNYGHQFIGAWR